MDIEQLILCLNTSGYPLRWITYKDGAFYYSKDLIAWSIGEDNMIIRGGTNRLLSTKTKLELPPILAIKGADEKAKKSISLKITNKILFKRDNYTCGYCEKPFTSKMLTRDHIVPLSKNGKNSWENLITSCKPCNHGKSDKSLEDLNMKLMMTPYEPSIAEYLIHKNTNMLDVQREYLMKYIPKHSRILKRD